MNNIKRIVKDLSNVQKLPFTDHIYMCPIDEKDVTNIQAVIIGPRDSPYIGGIFLFQFHIPQLYPFTPPVVHHQTTTHRIHPNLYNGPNGKVCLSILNTWGKNEWASSLTFEVVLRTIQSLLDKNPITFEPGYESSSNIKGFNYEMCVRWITIQSTLNILKNISHYHEHIQTFIRNNIKYIVDNIYESISMIQDGTYNTFHHPNIKISRQMAMDTFKQVTPKFLN